jgi:hypothetical protein
MRTIKTNEPTRYEVALVNATSGRKILVRYTAGKSGRDLISQMQDAAERIVKITGANEWKFVDRKKRLAGIEIGPDWKLVFTGRTQRDARSEGEIEWIGDAPEIAPADEKLADEIDRDPVAAVAAGTI